MPVLIDGYNLLRAVQKLAEEPDFIDMDLCAALCEYLHLTKDWGTIVFDGIGPPDRKAMMGLEILEVIFSGRAVEADAVIEEHIRDNSAPKRLVVVSSDRRILTAAARRKCQGVKSAEFWQQVCQALERPVPIQEPKEKRHGIGGLQTDQWLKKFGIDP